MKEYYFHVDNTPTHSYMKYLYKYPQRAFPYARLVEENGRRSTLDFEYELLDTGIFDEDRYFDIAIEYAKRTPEDICIRIEATNLWPRSHSRCTSCRTSGSATPGAISRRSRRCTGSAWGARRGPAVPVVWRRARPRSSTGRPYRAHTPLGARTLYGPPDAEVLFTDNETNRKLAPDPGRAVRSTFFKDAFHRHIIAGEPCTNPNQFGTKAAYHVEFPTIPPGGSAVVRLRLTDGPAGDDPLGDVDATVALRRGEADEFYDELHPPGASADERLIQRQALSGLLWTKQMYYYDVERLAPGRRPRRSPAPSRLKLRNPRHWKHLESVRIMTIPDKWEYPWFAAWDLAFQCVTMTLVDADFAKKQLWLLLFEQFLHPDGQIPAYEWEFSDNNPPVHAWAVWRVFNMDRIRSGKADRDWLERCFHKLLIHFTWWVNKLDRAGNNIFEGGFLGLDNITVFDRSVMCDDGSQLEQSDATGWMGMFCLNLMRIALELARENPVYEGLAIKFFQHYVYIAAAMKRMGNRGYGLWDDEDGFFYDVLSLHPDGSFRKFRVRSLVGPAPA